METNQPKKKNAGLMALIVVLLIITTIASCVGMYAWARYTSSQNGSSTAQVAKWYFNLKTGKATIGAETKTLLNLTRTDGYGHVVEGEIAPGTHGELPIIVDTTGTEVDLQYTVEVVIENCPTNMTFSSASGSTVTETRSGTGGDQDPKIATITITKYVSCNPENLNGEHNETLTWNWPYETFDTNNSAVAGDAADKADNGKTITVRVKATGIEKLEPPPAPVGKEIGDTVNYSTSLNGVTLDDWKVFYVDGDYTYIILDDYLPNAAISSTIQSTHDLSTYGTYDIYANNSREDLVSAMSTKANWDSLLTGTLNGHAVNETRTTNVWAIGAPTLDLWVNSWNASYSTDTVYTRYETGIDADLENEDDGYDGWHIGELANPSDTYIDLSNKTGYDDTLYFPHQEEIDEGNCYGYWLASPSAYGVDCVMYVGCNGYVNYDSCGSASYAFRPVVCLPSSVVNQ